MISVQVKSVFFRFFGMMAELRPSGFPEYSPAEQLVFDQIVGIIQAQYQQFWYTHIHTPAVEKNDVLLAKNWEETGKQIFWLYGMAQGAEDLKEYGLHFDLTVPFARYTLDWEHQLTFPFKRYQIQPVWRWERAQKGRFREFFQCDIDAIWKGEKEYFYYDAEIIAVLGKTLTEVLAAVKIQDSVCFHINNKKIVNGVLGIVGKDEKQREGIAQLIDKIDKITPEEFQEWLEKLGLNQSDRDRIDAYLKSISFYESSSLNSINPYVWFPTVDENSPEEMMFQNIFMQWIREVDLVLNALRLILKSLGINIKFCFDPKIIRGLDYYTGTIFEAVFENEPQLGSICWGGRYQNLTGYIDPKRNEYCGVWGSIWISRILSRVFSVQETRKQTVADYLIVQFEGGMSDSLAVGARFLAEGKCFEVYPYAEKLWKQFAYADKKGIPFVVIYGEGEREKWIYKLKNMQSWEEQEVPLH